MTTICDEDQTETIDQTRLILHPTPRVRLGTVRECRRELVKVYQEARSGKMDTQTATRLSYLLQTLVGMIAASDVEERVAILEQEIARR